MHGAHIINVDLFRHLDGCREHMEGHTDTGKWNGNITAGEYEDTGKGMVT